MCTHVVELRRVARKTILGQFVEKLVNESQIYARKCQLFTAEGTHSTEHGIH